MRSAAVIILATLALASCADPTARRETSAPATLAAGGARSNFTAPPAPSITAGNSSQGKWVQFSAVDGSGFWYVPCGGDLTHNGAPRWYLHAELTGTTHPDGVTHTELVAYDEQCSLGSVLTNNPGLVRNMAMWSHDGRRVAYYGFQYDDAGQRTQRGVWVGDVVCDPPGCGVGGRPVAILNERLAIPHVDAGRPSWAPDNQRVAYDGRIILPSAYQWDLYVGNVDLGTETNITNTETRSELSADWSPTSEQILFHMPITKPARWDVFRISANGGAITQITNGKNTSTYENTRPAWSDDGLQIAFAGLSNNGRQQNVFRLSASGSGTAVNLTNSSYDKYAGALWRR